MTNEVESLAVRIKTNNSCCMNVICIYRPPAYSIESFNNTLEENIFPNIGVNTVLCGDLNINLFNPLNLISIDQFVSIMMGHGFFPFINRPSRLSPNNPFTKYSLLDQIWLNFSPDYNIDSGVIMVDISDHMPVMCEIKMDICKNKS